MKSRRFAIRLAAVGALVFGLPSVASAQASSAYSLEDVVGLIRSHVPAPRILTLAKQNCLSFTMTTSAVARLRRAGATASLIKGLKGACNPDTPKTDGAAADSVPASAAPTVPAAPPAAPVDSNVDVKIRAAVVGSDLSVRPVPQMDLYIISPRGDTTRTSTDLEGLAEGTFKEGVYRIESVSPVVVGDARYRWGFFQQFAKDMRPVEMTQKNAMIDSIPQPSAQQAPASPAPAESTAARKDSSADTTHADTTHADSTHADTTHSNGAAKPEIKEADRPVHRPSTEKEIFDKYRGGIFTLYGARRGTAFLVDSTGLVVTNAHLIRGADEIRVQVDSATKVYARRILEDDAKDIAVVAINMSRCGSCVVLPLFDSTKSTAPAAGDRVLALGSPLNKLSVFSTGIVSSADGQSVVSDVSVGRLNTGGPLVNLDGYVIGLNTNRETDLAQEADSRVATSVAAPALAAAVATAHDSLPALASKPVTDSLLPVLPHDPFPQAPIAAVSALPQVDLRPYRTGAGPFRVFIMTPQIMAWRQKQAALALASKKQHDPRKAALWTTIDPIQEWRDWDEFLAERRAVVIVNVVPEQTEFPYYDRDKLPSIGDGNFKDMKIYRDGVEIIPVQKVRVPAVLNVAEMQAAGRPIPMQGIYIYRIQDFAPRAVGTTADYRVSITDAASPSRPVAFTLQPTTIEQLWKDFTAYRFSR